MEQDKNSKIWLSPPHMSGHEQEFITNAFKTNWLAPTGPNVDHFEQDLEVFLGDKSHVAVLNSGTAALHLSLILLNIKSGDDVICQSKTFTASANPIVYLGAKPIFIDSEKDTWNMCPELLEVAIKDCISKGKKPKAIIAVHLYGMPYNVDDINSIANRYNIPVIEDSAEALGSMYKTKKCGTLGTMSVLSFNGNKIITTSGGGALISKELSIKQKAIFLASQARDAAPEYLHSHIGYNYRMSNVLAGIGRGQMKVIHERIQQRRSNFEFYHSHLSSIDGITFQNEPNGYLSNRWLTCILLESYEKREGLRMELVNHNIDSRPLWKPLHQQPIFKDYKAYVNGVSDDLFEKGLCLPSGSNLTNTNLNKIISVIKSYFSK
jgi:dTDP-4-amino-4,6-dideoxygalactose transaminase